MELALPCVVVLEFDHASTVHFAPIDLAVVDHLAVHAELTVPVRHPCVSLLLVLTEVHHARRRFTWGDGGA